MKGRVHWACCTSIHLTHEPLLRIVAADDKIHYLKRTSLPWFITGTDVAFLTAFRLLRVFVFFRRLRSVDSLDGVRVLGARLVFLGTCLFNISTIPYSRSAVRTTQGSGCSFSATASASRRPPSFSVPGTARASSHPSTRTPTPWWGVVTMTTVGYCNLAPLPHRR